MLRVNRDNIHPRTTHEDPGGKVEV